MVDVGLQHWLTLSGWHPHAPPSPPSLPSQVPLVDSSTRNTANVHESRGVKYGGCRCLSFLTNTQPPQRPLRKAVRSRQLLPGPPKRASLAPETLGSSLRRSVHPLNS